MLWIKHKQLEGRGFMYMLQYTVWSYDLSVHGTEYEIFIYAETAGCISVSLF